MSMAFLPRAITDQVPPVFGCQNFAEVANNYKAGSRSFREHMAHLDNSLRKVADGNLHTHIRRKESVPTETQVNFRAAIGELLAELIRVASAPPPSKSTKASA